MPVDDVHTSGLVPYLPKPYRFYTHTHTHTPIRKQSRHSVPTLSTSDILPPPTQVQLLVTSQDVENYKQIKSDLDQLRSIVEKSELWVYKRQGPDEGMDAGEGLSTDSKHKEIGRAHV